MATTATVFVLIRCPSCSTPRTVSTRHARRNPQVCRSCSTTKPATLGDMVQWWLERFQDDELALIAESIFELPLGSIDHGRIAAARNGTLTAP